MRDRDYSHFSLVEDLSGALARVFDVFWFLAASYLSYWLRFDQWAMPVNFQMVALLGALIGLISYSICRVYESWRGRRKIHLFGLICSAHLCAYAVLSGVLVFSYQAEHFSRLWLGGWIVLSLVGVIGFRVLVYQLLNYLREKGMNQKQLVVVGDQKSTEKIKRNLADKPWLGLRIVEVFVINDQTTLDPIPGLVESVIESAANEVWICLPLKVDDMVGRILYSLRHSTVNIRYFPSFSGLRLINHSSTILAGMPVFDLSCSPLDGINRIVKSFEDRVLGLAIFFVISPLLVVIAIGVKLSSPGPIIFKQYRHGIDGRRINIYKFRSMKTHHEEAEFDDNVTQASREDIRTTRFGRFLRKTSLDELPQFFNVIQGKMSIVGPRPHALAHNEFYKEEIEYYMKRHKVKPGITGWAQVNGFRGETDTIDKMRKRIEYDLFYIENWSLLFDLKIILMTCFKGFVHKNAY